MIPALAFIVVALAAYRVTRLVTRDSITEPARERVYQWAWDDENPVADGVDEQGRTKYRPAARAPWRTYVYELLTCPWCFGVWASIACYYAWRSDVDAFRVVLAVLAVAGVQGFLASREG